MNRGVPTEESLQHMRAGDPPVHYLVGTPKGRLSKLEKDHRKAGLKSVQPVAVGAIEVQGVDAIKARARCPHLRSAERREGKAGVSTCRTRWSQDHKNKSEETKHTNTHS